MLSLPLFRRRIWEGSLLEVNIVPTEVYELRYPQAVKIRHPDHRGVTVPVAPIRGDLRERLDFLRRQMFSGAKLVVLPPIRLNCPTYISWDALRCRLEGG